MSTTSLLYLANDIIQLIATGFFASPVLPPIRAPDARIISTDADLRLQPYRGQMMKRLIEKDAISQAHEFVKKPNLIQVQR